MPGHLCHCPLDALLVSSFLPANNIYVSLSLYIYIYIYIIFYIVISLITYIIIVWYPSPEVVCVYVAGQTL